MSEADPSPFSAGLWCEPGGLLRGFALDERDPAARLAVEILADGEPVALLRAEGGADAAGGDLAGDGCHGFALRLDEATLAHARRIVARLANHDRILAALDLAGGGGAFEAPAPPLGRVTGSAGTRLFGHVPRERDGGPPPTVRALLDGREVARTEARGWVELDWGGLARSFALDLPAAFADGRARAVEVVTAAGSALAGSPLLVVAFPDPLADWIDGWAELASEAPRARFADALLPRTLPFSALDAWLERFGLPDLPERRGERVAVVLVGEAGRTATLASLEAQAGIAWRAAALPTEGSPVGFDPGRLQELLLGEMADCALVVMAVAGTRFAPDALARLADAASLFPSSRAFYPDLLVSGQDGRRWPLAFPDFDPELFLETGYCGIVYAVRRADVLASGGRASSLYGLFPGDASAPPGSRPVHLPFPLATVPDLPARSLLAALAAAARARLAADGEAAAVEVDPEGGGRAVRVRRAPPRASASALVALRDEPSRLDATLAALEREIGRGLDEIVLVDNESSDERALALLASAAGRGHRVLRVPGWFCPARLLSLGAGVARGDHLLVVEPGIGEGGAGWLEEMRGRLAGRGVGAVGALVASASGVVRDAGFAFGPRCAPAPRFLDRRAGDPGYAGLLGAAHGCSAVSSACFLTPRALFSSRGGFDAAAFPRHHFALDYCLRLGAEDLRVVLTPHACLAADGAARPRADAASPTLAHETRLLVERWGVAPGCDPFYGPWMAMDGVPYSGLAWPPAPYRPRAGRWPAPSIPPFAL